MIVEERGDELIKRTSFFKVENVPIFFRSYEVECVGVGYREITDFRGIQDCEKDFIIHVVSPSYFLISNREAYEWSEELIKRGFEKLTLKDFSCSVVRMKQNRGNMFLDLQCEDESFWVEGEGGDYWKPFVRVINSYDGSKKLSYSIGYLIDAKRQIVLRNEIISMAGKHSCDARKKLEQKIKKGEIKIFDITKKFRNQLAKLRECSCSRELFLAMAFKTFDLHVPNKQAELENVKRTVEQSEMFYDMLCGEHSSHDTLYSALKYLASFATVYAKEPEKVHGMQCRVGVFMDELLKAVHDKGLSCEKFIGEEYIEDAEKIRGMIEKSGCPKQLEFQM